MLAMGVIPGKVWLLMPGLQRKPWPPVYEEEDDGEVDQRLRYRTPNQTDCFVDTWIWHCAPTICVRRMGMLPWGTTMVIDPSLFDKPVTKQEWRGKNRSATFMDSKWEYYLPPWQKMMWPTLFDPNFEETRKHLEALRIRLRVRSASAAGPPPYSYCQT